MALNANDETTSYDYVSDSNRLNTVGARAIKLDAMGNTLTDGKRRFEYNESGRLSALYVHGRLLATYEYNAQGLRTEKKCAHGFGFKMREDYARDHRGRERYDCDGTTLYHYDQNGQLIAETTRHGEPIKTYIWVNGRPIAQATSDDHYGAGEAKGKDKQSNWLQRWFHEAPKESLVYLQTDQLGTPRTATDANGNLVWRWDGNAFGDSAPVRIVQTKEHENRGQHRGDERGHKGKGENHKENHGHSDDRSIAIPDRTFVSLRFPGQYYDAESGLNYNWHRYYDPKTGRYITSDPIGLDGGLNTYSYSNANPNRFVDFTGLCAGCKKRTVVDMKCVIEANKWVRSCLKYWQVGGANIKLCEENCGEGGFIPAGICIIMCNADASHEINRCREKFQEKLNKCTKEVCVN